MTDNKLKALAFLAVEVSSNSLSCKGVWADKAINTIIKEKIQCGIGNYKGNKNLNKDGVKLLKGHLKKYKENLIDLIDFTEIKVIGTGALREADDAKGFKKWLKKELGIKLKIVSGKKEAKYAALGVKSSFKNPNGIVWDMGGRSSEFAIIKNGAITKSISLPLGVFSIEEHDAPKKYIEEQLKKLPDEYKEEFKNLYFVGGAPRQILKAHKFQEEGHKDNIHGYKVSKKITLTFTKNITKTPKDELRDAFNISKKRINHIQTASLLANALMHKFNIKSVIASEYGVRDGVLHEMQEKYAAAHEL